MSAPPSFLRHLVTRRCGIFAGYTFLVYDHMLTFPLEVQYIWNAPWTAVKIGFLLNRYGNLIGQGVIVLEETGWQHLSYSPKFCAFFRLYCTFFVIISAESIRILVLMRAWAIWGYQYRVAVSLITLYVLYVISVSTAIIYSNITAKPFLYASKFGVCLGPIESHRWTIWLAPLILDSIVLILVFYNLQKQFTTYALYPSPLVRLLLRDAVLFYVASAFNSMFIITCWSVLRQDPRRFLHIAISSPLMSVVGQRLILNLREFQRNSFDTRDLSRVVNRQIAAICSELELVGTDTSTDIELTEATQDGSDNHTTENVDRLEVA